MFKKKIFDVRRQLGSEDAQAERLRQIYFKMDELKVGTNFNGEYVPTYSYFRRQNIPGIPNGYMYFKPETKNRNGTGKSTYDDLFVGLNQERGLKYFIFSVGDMNHTLTLVHGYISDRFGNILLVLCMKKYLKTFDPENFKLFVATEFMTDEMYKNVWKKVEKDYVSVIQAEGISIEYMQSAKIDKMIFNGAPPIKVRSITELQAHKKKMLEYFQWHASLDEGEHVMGEDYYARKLIKDGYTVNNLKSRDPEFQPMVWRIVTTDIYDEETDERMSFEKFLKLVERMPVKRHHYFKVILPDDESYSLLYVPETHEIIDRVVQKRFKLELTNSDLVRKYSENINDTILSLQNYVNFASNRNEDYTEVNGGTRIYHTVAVPEGMEVTSDTPPEAIG